MLVGRAWTSSRLRSAPGFEQADTVIGGTDQVVLGTFQLQVVHVELLVHLAAMEEKLVGGDGKQGAGQLPHALDIEILQVLRRQDQGGIALAHPLEAVTDVLNGGQVGQPEVELVQGGHGVAFGKELVAEVGQQVEQQASLTEELAWIRSLTPNTRNLVLVMFVRPLK